jgi:hypothetical protein
LIFKKEEAYQRLRLPRHSESKYYPKSGLDLVLVDSNDGASFAKGNIDNRTYDQMVAKSADLAADLKQKKITSREPEGDAIVRVLALRHHPLPQATGEGKRVLGIPDEPLMYLVSPATFLEAAISIDVGLVLHGHRHVQGLTRYSIPDPSNSKVWHDVYILACPSSTGARADYAGFNIIFCQPKLGNRTLGIDFKVTRFIRPKNVGAFKVVDFAPKTLGVITLPLRRRRPFLDPAFEVSHEVFESVRIERKQALRLTSKLLDREAFRDTFDKSWDVALYVHIVSHQTFEKLLEKFSKTALVRDKNAYSVLANT